jgi:hypothetical protein
MCWYGRDVMRRWYRSWLFLLGIPGFLFLLWVSLGNPNRISKLEVRLGEHSLAFTDRLLMLQVRVAIPETGRFEPLDIGVIKPTVSKSLGEPPGRLPPAVQSMGWHSGRRSSSGAASIAYWFLAVIYLVVWGVSVALWQRRKARLEARAVG